MKNFNVEQFMSEAKTVWAETRGKRYGQFLVNYLSKKHPEIHLPDEADCYYDNKKVDNFLRFIHNYSDNSHRIYR